MKIIYGTGNQAKLKFMREAIKLSDIEIIGIRDVLADIPVVEETGNDPLENAVIKAGAYYKALNAPVFSCDSGLFIDGLEKAQQPGVYVRTVNGKYLTDNEMIDYYSKLSKQLGGRCTARYVNAICLIYDKNHVLKYRGSDISSESFIISSVPHERRTEGFPLDSLSVHIGSGKYFFDLEGKDASNIDYSGFEKFFVRVLESLSA